MENQDENEKKNTIENKIMLSSGIKGLIDMMLEDVVSEDIKSSNSGDSKNGTETDQSIA